MSSNQWSLTHVLGWKFQWICNVKRVWDFHSIIPSTGGAKVLQLEFCVKRNSLWSGCSYKHLTSLGGFFCYFPTLSNNGFKISFEKNCRTKFMFCTQEKGLDSFQELLFFKKLQAVSTCLLGLQSILQPQTMLMIRSDNYRINIHFHILDHFIFSSECLQFKNVCFVLANTHPSSPKNAPSHL